jgi:hypothetical protein
VQRDELHAERVEFAERVDELAQAAGEPVIPVNNNRAEPPLPTSRQ